MFESNFAHLILNILSQLQKTIIPLNAPILRHFTKKDHYSMLYLWTPSLFAGNDFPNQNLIVYYLFFYNQVITYPFIFRFPLIINLINPTNIFNKMGKLQMPMD